MSDTATLENSGPAGTRARPEPGERASWDEGGGTAAPPGAAAGTRALRIPALRLGGAPRAGVGRGSAVGHHGEILQGMVRCRDGRLRRALVSLPCRLFRSETRFVLDGSAEVTVEPAGMNKARRAAELALAHLGVENGGGTLTVRSSIPPRLGFGSSTADVVATLRAVVRAHRRPVAPEALARLAVQAEVASDPAMFVRTAVLFAQREGLVLEYFGRPLPPLEVLGFDADPRAGGVDTLAFAPAEYGWREAEAFRPLVGLLRHAVRTRDARLVGRVATASARINQQHLPKPRFAELEAIAREAGGIGVQVAHSGTVAGLLFDGACPQVQRQMDRARASLEAAGIGTVWNFRTTEGDE